MSEFWIVMAAVMPVFTLACIGFGLRRIDWLTEESDKSLMKLVINVLIPCLIFQSVLGNRAVKEWENLLFPPLIGFLSITIGLVVAKVWARQFALFSNPKEASTFALATGAYNYGYVPIPLAMSLFDRETLAVLLVHNIGVEMALWSIGLWMIAGTGKRGNWKKLINAPLLAMIITLTLNLTDQDKNVPGFVMSSVQMLGQCAIPLGLILIGATMADLLPEIDSRSHIRSTLHSCLLRLLILPSLFLLGAHFLISSVELKKVVLLQAAMPCAVFSILMARHYEGRPSIAMNIVLATSALGLITIPLWIQFGMKWLLR